MGLVDVHSRNVVHLDLKPENIMWFSENDYRFKLLDFGSSVFVGAVAHGLTTPAYTAPEILRSAETGQEITVHTSADIWSIGIIAFEVLVGPSLFDSAIFIKEFKQGNLPLIQNKRVTQ